jgi:hypothetical protein
MTKSNIDMGDSKLKNDTAESQGQGEPELPNVPKDAVGNYDPDKAAPGGYNLPPSFGPSAGAGMPAASKTQNPDAGEAEGAAGDSQVKSTDKSANKEGKQDEDDSSKSDSTKSAQKLQSDKKSGDYKQQDKNKDAMTSSAEKEKLDKPDTGPIHGDQGGLGVTPGEKAASTAPNTKTSK